TAETVSAADAPQRGGGVVRGAGPAGARDEPAPRPGAAVCGPARGRGLGESRPGHPAVAARTPVRDRGAAAPRESLRLPGHGDTPDAGDLCLEQHGDRGAAGPEPSPDGTPVHAPHTVGILPAAGSDRL